jgi:hypothetical protein
LEVLVVDRKQYIHRQLTVAIDNFTLNCQMRTKSLHAFVTDFLYFGIREDLAYRFLSILFFSAGFGERPERVVSQFFS